MKPLLKVFQWWGYQKASNLVLSDWTFEDSLIPSSSRKSFRKTSNVYLSFAGYSRFSAYSSPIKSVQAFAVLSHLVSTSLPSIMMETSAGTSSVAACTASFFKMWWVFAVSQPPFKTLQKKQYEYRLVVKNFNPYLPMLIKHIALKRTYLAV